MILKFCHWFILLNLILLLQGCDFISPQKQFKLAIPAKDFSYRRTANHLKEFLEGGGFSIELIYCRNAIDANRMIANAEADLTFVMDHSTFIPKAIGPEARKLRTIVPIYQRLFFLFARPGLDVSRSTNFNFQDNSIGIEVLDGETHQNLNHLLEISKIDSIKIVDKDHQPDLMHFWGTFYGERASDLLHKGWSEISVDQNWINYITLNDPALHPYTLPAIPGEKGSINLHTVSSRTLLVGGGHLQDNAIYRLSEYLFQHKLELVGLDKMYRFISDSFDKRQILYPVHSGADKYLRRNQPSFFERYAEVMAMIFSIGAIVYGAIQGIRNRLIKIKKERIDTYFLNYLEIRSQEKFSDAEKAAELSELLQRALVQLTNEKLDKNDFHIFSRLIQQELLILRQT